MSPRIQIFCAVLWNSSAAGPIFGFAALKPILVSQGVYSEVCDSHDINGCAAQDMKLNFMFTVSAGVTNVIASIVGFVSDRKGPRICGYIGSVFLSMGALLLANSSFITYFDPFLFGYLSLAIGGPFVFISTFQLSNAIPQHSGKILAAITGAFDSSSAVFMFYRLYYQNVAALSIHTFFTCYLVVPLFIVSCEAFIMPKDSYSSLGVTQKSNVEGLNEDGDSPDGMRSHRDFQDLNENTEVMHRHMSQSTLEPMNRRQSRISRASRISHVSDRRRKSVLEEFVGHKLELRTKGVYGILHGNTVKTQLKSPWFSYISSLTVICMLRLNYFMATVRSQEAYLLDSATKAETLGSIFDIALPIGGLLAIPLIGLGLDNSATVDILKLMCTCSVLIGISGLTHSFISNLVGISLLVVYRPFYYTVTSDYCTKVFGFETFGTVYGLLISISGISNSLQAVIDGLTHTVFHMNPTPLNSLMTLMTAIISVLMIRYVNKEVAKRYETNLAGEETSLSPDLAIV